MKAAGIPVVTYDIADPGMYFVGIDNLAAGIAGGEGLGQIIKEKWNCEPDLVISAEGAGAGIVNEWRTGGMRTGLKNICPDIPAEKWVSLREQRRCRGRPAGGPRSARRASRRQVKMAVVGLNDGGVLGADPGRRAARPRRRGDRLGPGRRLHHRRQRQSAPRGLGVLLPRRLCGLRDPRRDRADRRGQAAAAQGRCRRSGVAGRAVPGDGASRPRRCRTCRSGVDAAARRARRAPPSTSSSARTSKPIEPPMPTCPRPRIAATGRRRGAPRDLLLRRLGDRGRAALARVAAADRRDRRSIAPTSCRTRRCWRSPSPCRSSACWRSAQALVAHLAAAFSISASRAA